MRLDRATTEVRTVKRRHIKQKRDPVTKEVLFEFVEEWTEDVLPDGRLMLEVLTRLDPEHWASPRARGARQREGVGTRRARSWACEEPNPEDVAND